MSIFLGIFPDDLANHKIKKVIGEVGRVFDGQQIPIRWSDPNTFHVTVFNIGKDVSILKRILLKKSLKQITFKPFTISFKAVRLGISRKYKELLYLLVDKGDDQMRKITEQIDIKGDLRGSNTFVPHLTLGRVSKELTDEEFKNLSKDLENVSEDLDIEEISFEVKSISLLKGENGNYEVLMNCLAS